MNPPKIDRASVALAKKIDAKIRADAEYELKTRMQSMSASERAKLKSLVNNIKFLGDVGKAMEKSRVSRELLDKWMNMPGVSWHINIASNEAQALLHCGRTADDVLWWAKIAPELDKEAEHFKATGQRHRESRVIAKLAARSLKDYRWHILQAANNNDKHFLIDLGKCLTGELSTDFYDQLDYANFLRVADGREKVRNLFPAVSAADSRGNVLMRSMQLLMGPTGRWREPDEDYDAIAAGVGGDVNVEIRLRVKADWWLVNLVFAVSE